MSEQAAAPIRMRLRTVPNAITASRLVLAPLTLWAHQMGTDGGDIATGWLMVCLVGLVAAEVTDVMDGIVARRLGQVSDLGKLLDPLSDSIFRQMVFLGFLVSGWMPLWMMAVLFARDILVAYLRVFSGLQRIVLAARVTGKVKAIVQATAQIAGVILYAFHEWGVWESLIGVTLPTAQIVWWLCFIATAVTAWSAFDYANGVLGTWIRQELSEDS